jgi:hypothetical protein
LFCFLGLVTFIKPTIFYMTSSQEEYKTYIVRHEQDQRINDIAWWERKDKKVVIQEALDKFIETKKDVPVKTI